MSGNVLKYKGYSAIIEYSAEDQVLHGKIDGIRDMVDFSSESATEIEKEFQTAVDEYLAFCAEIGKEPDREYSGTFNVRIKPETHRQIAIRASHEGHSLNAEVEKAIENYLKQPKLEQPHDIQITVRHQIVQSDLSVPMVGDNGWEGVECNGYNFQRASTVLN